MTVPHPAPGQQHWQWPRLSESRVVAGVAGGIADEIGVDPIVIRAAFVVLAIAGGWGIALYGIAWVVMASVGADDDEVRQRHPKGRDEIHRFAGIALVVAGILFLARASGGAFLDSVVWPAALFAAGVVVAHHRGVDIGLGRVAELGEDDRSAFLLRIAGGAILVLCAVTLAVSLNFDLGAAFETIVIVGMVLAGLVLVLGPWIVKLINDLTLERRARIRSEERAEVAAHLHDSVLQTLSLIQRRADDPEVVGLARTQERELRNWLYGRANSADPRFFRSLLERELAEVETLHAVPVEVVVVGDAVVDEELVTVVAATREAVANAARHSNAASVDVFAEVSDTAVDVFVRDTGDGFDPAAVAPDRRGLAESIVGRLERCGGAAAVTSAPGHGTEVELHLERRQQ